VKRTVPLLICTWTIVGCSTPSPREVHSTPVTRQSQLDPEGRNALFSELGLVGVLGSQQMPAIRQAVRDYAASAYPNCVVVGVTSGVTCRGMYLSNVDLACKSRKTNSTTVGVAVRMFVKDDNTVYWKAESASTEYTALFTACLLADASKRK